MMVFLDYSYEARIRDIAIRGAQKRPTYGGKLPNGFLVIL